MTLVRATLLLAAALLVATVSITAQGQSSTPAAKTWTDADFDKLMKDIGGAFGAMRKAVDGQNQELAKTNAARLEQLFGEVEAFWTSRNVKEAADMANTAESHAAAIAAAIDGKDFGKASETSKELQGSCAACHKQYRDKGPDGQYRIKP